MMFHSLLPVSVLQRSDTNTHCVCVCVYACVFVIEIVCCQLERGRERLVSVLSAAHLLVLKNDI